MEKSMPVIRNKKVQKLSSILKLMQTYPSVPLNEVSEAVYHSFEEWQVKDIIKGLEGLIEDNKDD